MLEIFVSENINNFMIYCDFTEAQFCWALMALRPRCAVLRWVLYVRIRYVQDILVVSYTYPCVKLIKTDSLYPTDLSTLCFKIF